MSHLCQVNGTNVGCLSLGSTIKIDGVVCHGADRFDIDLKCGPCGDTAMHSSFRFLEGAIARNDCRHGRGWGCEERCGGLPLCGGQSFCIEMKVECNAIKVFINGCHAYDFCHRLPYNTISFVSIHGSCTISCVSRC